MERGEGGEREGRGRGEEDTFCGSWGFGSVMEANSGSTTREDCTSYSTFSTPPSKPPSIPIARRVGFLAGGNSSPVGRGEGGYGGGRRGGEREERKGERGEREEGREGEGREKRGEREGRKRGKKEATTVVASHCLHC